MALLICPSTGARVDATGESYERLIQAGYKPVRADPMPQNADGESTESPKRRAKRPVATK